MTDIYRPWGPLKWLMPRLPGRSWSLLGVLGTEERCTATLSCLSPNELGIMRFLHIRDPAPFPKAAFDTRHSQLRSLLENMGAPPVSFRDVRLLDDIDAIEDELNEFLASSTPHVILDITSMPKWWFFPLIRMLLADNRVETLIATYASAENYGKQLSSDPAPLAPLPTFSEPPDRLTHDELIVGIGFAPLSLRELYSTKVGKIRYLFPFPPGPPNFFRNWEFLRILETEIENRSMEAEDRWHVHMYDCPSVFEALRRFTNDGSKTSALAPFGPKTFSLAMCVFALAASEAGKPPVHVFYTQPRRYELDYTSGIKKFNGVPDIKAYCLRLEGRNVYQL